MDEIKQNSLASKLLRLLRVWLEELIPEETKDCIRSKVAIVVAKNQNNTYNVVLSEDFGDYLDLVHRRDMSQGDPDYDPKQKLTPAEFATEVAKISIDNLFSIKNETYAVDNYVIVGYLDNKLTNAFILCKNRG